MIGLRVQRSAATLPMRRWRGWTARPAFTSASTPAFPGDDRPGWQERRAVLFNVMLAG